MTLGSLVFVMAGTGITLGGMFGIQNGVTVYTAGSKVVAGTAEGMQAPHHEDQPDTFTGTLVNIPQMIHFTIVRELPEIEK